jgi:hypothetical protein
MMMGWDGWDLPQLEACIITTGQCQTCVVSCCLRSKFCSKVFRSCWKYCGEVTWWPANELSETRYPSGSRDTKLTDLICTRSRGHGSPRF